jgi:Cu-processing system permease protein
MSLVFAASAVAISLFGLRTLRELGLAGAGAAGDGLLNLGVLLPPLLGLLLGAGSIAGSRESGALAMMTAQPVRPAAAVVGWFLGLTAAMWLIVAVAFGAAGVAIGAVIQGSDLVSFTAVVGVTLLLAATSVAIGMAVSSVTANRMQALAVVVALWFALAIGMDLLLVVIVPGLQLGTGALLAAVLVNPLESARLLAVLTIEGDTTSLGIFGTFLVERFGQLGSRVMLATSLIVWTVASLAVAHAALRHRDL